MASKTTLNARNLAALGADRLAELLLEITKGNAGAKRQLRLELASEVGSGDVAREIRKRLSAIARSQSFIDWQGRNAFAADLDMQRRAIVAQIGPVDPAAAHDLIWRFVALANGVYERCDDSTGRVQALFHEACEDLIDLAEIAEPDPLALADQLLEALTDDDYGHYPTLISGLAPILGSLGLQHLKAGITASEFDLSDNYALRVALEQIADVEGDAESRGLEHALVFESFTTALHFLMTWPATEQAAVLITNRAAEIDGHHYELLGLASDALEDRHPLAATLLKRGLIDFALQNARVKRYRHAARHLRECKNLAARIDDFALFETHEAYLAGLRQTHGKKTSFWRAVG